MQRMGSERMESKKHIKSLKPKNDQEFILIKSHLQQLYHALKGPTIDRVFRLSGLNPPIDFLLPKSNPKRRDPKSRKILKKVFWFNRLNSGGRARTKHEKPSRSPTVPSTFMVGDGIEFKNLESYSPIEVPHDDRSGAVKDNILSESYPADLVFSSKAMRISQGEYPRTNVPMQVPRQDGSLMSGKEEGVSLENVKIQRTGTAEVGGDELSYINDKIINETVDIWNFLQGKLIAFSKAPADPKKAKFQLAFLKSLFQLGDYIFRYELLPPAFIESIEIFKPKTLSEMVKFHIDLLFLKHGPKFFVAKDSVVPQLEFLTNGLTLKHFHRSIKALSAEDQKYPVYLALTSILQHMEECFPESESSPDFRLIAQGFRLSEFLEQADSLSLQLHEAPGIEHLNRSDNVLMFELTESFFACFQHPTLTVAQSRIQFQMVYYMLEFVDQYYKPMTAAILAQWGSFCRIQQKLKFMNLYLKFFRDRDQYPSSMYENLDMSFLEMLDNLEIWIKYRIKEIFDKKKWLEIRGTVPKAKFNLWMSEMKKPKFPFFS
ncbi:uncharacterized protein PGTG_15363 [Puccinia graminis f. sp. tritici CRL 75-36-700-3]|uniref:Uncharacterized protein n=1 Tax=Puccinia graminis f. sp. tritici (strain CRL 75-36-700-3 / race SCCL) TaxID=418459 RepID=E3KZI2_PUCGT|nr:uncharacterized protein PGTG_15363 [Puccinia graminis f. sp. tritici CRL 75-36-700-3]EFP89707.2 hypothetical protein PGTG_15363 [Puccinia graminis f. sp. tritici CRL 75-36-700-3]